MNDKILIGKKEYDFLIRFYNKYKKIEKILRFINRYYYKDTNQFDYEKYMIQGILSGLKDKNSRYFDKNEMYQYYEEYRISKKKSNSLNKIKKSIEKVIFDKEFIYIKIRSFGCTVYDEFHNILTTNNIEEISTLVIDLRNNNGGDIKECIKIADLILNKKSFICQIKNNRDEEIIVSKTDPCCKWNIIVLVNDKTASAAELLTSAIKENKGLVIGKKTYGKATIQSVLSLEDIDDSGIKITVAEFFGQRGKKIEEIGIMPNYVINDIDSLKPDKILEIVKQMMQEFKNEKEY